MKKSVFTVFFALLGAGAFAQATQGTIAVTGSVNLRNETIKNHSGVADDHKLIRRTVILTPAVGYFVQDGLELGFGIGLSRFSSKSKLVESDMSERNLDISLRPYLRKYIPLTEQLQLHGTGFAAVGFGNTITKNDTSDATEVIRTSSNIGFGLYPGLTYFATPKLGLTATFGSLSFSRTKEKPKDDAQPTRTTSSLAANLHPSSISIGFGYFIAR